MTPLRNNAAAPLRPRLGRLILVVAALLAIGFGGLANPGTAEAAKPCWKRLINDWYDGRIDSTYPVKCYRDAIRNLPEDVKSYSSARDDIQRALLAAIRENPGIGPNDPIKPGPKPPPRSNPGPNAGPNEKPAETAEGPAGGRERPDGPISEVLDKIGPSNADSIPVPLLVLAGLALLLLAAAATGFVARRLQERRVRVDAGSPPGSDPRS